MFVARSLSVKLNSRRNSTRSIHESIYAGEEACSPKVSLYSQPAKKDMPMVAPRRPTGMSLLHFHHVSLLPLVSISLRAPLCSALTVKLTDSSEPILRIFCSLRFFDVHGSIVATSILPSKARRDIGTRSHVITSTRDSERLDASMPESRLNSWQQIENESYGGVLWKFRLKGQGFLINICLMYLDNKRILSFMAINANLHFYD